MCKGASDTIIKTSRLSPIGRNILFASEAPFKNIDSSSNLTLGLKYNVSMSLILLFQSNKDQLFHADFAS